MIHFLVVCGSKRIECKTREQVWKVLGELPFGSAYTVSSPTGKNVDEFIPF